MSEQNIENVEGDVNVESTEAPAEETPAKEESPAENPESGDTNGDDAQQDTGALQE